MTSVNFKQILNSTNVVKEYEMSYWLKVFSDICEKMDTDMAFKSRVMQLYRESYDEKRTTQALVLQEADIELGQEYCEEMTKWIKAHIMKRATRDSIPVIVKERLWNFQEGKCAICNQALGTNWTRIHVDHIVPWDLVGDELDNNYQDLCEKCNMEKNNSTNYKLLKILGLR